MTDVNDVLKTPPFENSVLVAGRTGLFNQVKSITVAETPDAADWLRGGEIICTSGFFIKHLSASQVVEWVESLVKNKAAALAIKTSRFIGEVPKSVKLLADSRSLPIIGLSHDVIWPYIIEAVIDLINDQNEKEQEMVQDLIHGHLHPSTLGNSFSPSIDWSSPTVVVLIQVVFEPQNELFKKNPPEFIKEMKETIRNEFGKCIIGYEENLFTVFIPQDRNKTESFLRLKKALEIRISSKKINIAIGSAYASKTRLKKSYEEAKRTLEMIQIIPSIGPVVSYEMMGVYRLIHRFEDYEFLESYRDDYLSDLSKHDKENDDTLCDTLRTYLQMGGNVTLTAKELFVHPNTVMYRLRKVKEIIGNPLDNPQYKNSLLLALEISYYLNALEK